jgi:hypothetical protein
MLYPSMPPVKPRPKINPMGQGQRKKPIPPTTSMCISGSIDAENGELVVGEMKKDSEYQKLYYTALAELDEEFPTDGFTDKSTFRVVDVPDEKYIFLHGKKALPLVQQFIKIDGHYESILYYQRVLNGEKVYSRKAEEGKVYGVLEEDDPGIEIGYNRQMPKLLA